MRASPFSLKPPKAIRLLGVWYARLDLSQRTTESELSGHQAANRYAARVWWGLHKFAVTPPLLNSRYYTVSSGGVSVLSSVMVGINALASLPLPRCLI